MKLLALTATLASTTISAQSDQKWFQELPKNFEKDSICGPIPPMIAANIPTQHYKIKHIIHPQSDGTSVEFAFGYPTVIYMDLCRANPWEIKDWSFKLVCEQTDLGEGESMMAWRFLEGPKKTCPYDNVDENDTQNHFKFVMNNWREFNERMLGGQVEKFEWEN